jgi:hypothetical protein
VGCYGRQHSPAGIRRKLKHTVNKVQSLLRKLKHTVNKVQSLLRKLKHTVNKVQSLRDYKLAPPACRHCELAKQSRGRWMGTAIRYVD